MTRGSLTSCEKRMAAHVADADLGGHDGRRGTVDYSSLTFIF